MTLKAYVFTKLQTAKEAVKQMFRKPLLVHCSTVNMLKGPKHFVEINSNASM